MAKYDVTYTCGHTGVIQLIGPHSQREWKLERENGRLCPDCYADDLRVKRETENAKAAAIAREQELPALTGTAKQIAWAETIRQSFIARLTDTQRLTKDKKFIERSKRFNESVPNDDKMSNVFDYVYAQTSAHWWIDNRRELIDETYSIWRTIDKFFKLSATITETVAEINPAQIEATVRPETPVTETVAEMRVLAKSVEVIFPEKRNDFWQIIKPQLKYEWHDKWTRDCRKPREYAAQTGNALLSAGFIIGMDVDELLRLKQITGLAALFKNTDYSQSWEVE